MSTNLVPCLVKRPISTIYRDGKPVDPQPVVGKLFDFTEGEMLAVMRVNHKALEPTTPTLTTKAVSVTQKEPEVMPTAARAFPASQPPKV